MCWRPKGIFAAGNESLHQESDLVNQDILLKQVRHNFEKVPSCFNECYAYR